MKTLPHIEDYLEVIAGKREPGTLKQNPTALFGYGVKPPINLARYDVSFVDSVTDTTLQGGALTDRQAELSIKIVIKYRRQLNGLGIDIDPASVPPFRKPLRMMDRTCSCMLEDDHIAVKFPYNQNWINTVRDMLKESQGGARFDKQAKTWYFDLTEYNVNWIVTWAKSNSFTIDPALTEILERIIQEGAKTYTICLQRNTTGELEITNAESTLLDFLSSRGLDFTDDNLAVLADWGSVLGYSVDESIWQELEQRHGSDLVPFMRQRNYELNGDFGQIDRVIRYGQLVNRLPMVIYDPSADNMMAHYRERLGDRIHIQGNSRVPEESAEFIYSHKVVRYPETIPLLVSHVGIIAGAEKLLMIQNSQKIIYFNKRLS